MDRRLRLHKQLQSVIGDVSENLYFQPPTGHRLKYPCVLYSKTSGHLTHADDKVYGIMDNYTITVIETDPDGQLAYNILNEFDRISYNTKFAKDGLYHTVLSLYF